MKIFLIIFFFCTPIHAQISLSDQEYSLLSLKDSPDWNTKPRIGDLRKISQDIWSVLVLIGSDAYIYLKALNDYTNNASIEFAFTTQLLTPEEKSAYLRKERKIWADSYKKSLSLAKKQLKNIEKHFPYEEFSPPKRKLSQENLYLLANILDRHLLKQNITMLTSDRANIAVIGENFHTLFKEIDSPPPYIEPFTLLQDYVLQTGYSKSSIRGKLMGKLFSLLDALQGDIHRWLVLTESSGDLNRSSKEQKTAAKKAKNLSVFINTNLTYFAKVFPQALAEKKTHPALAAMWDGKGFSNPSSKLALKRLSELAYIRLILDTEYKED